MHYGSDYISRLYNLRRLRECVQFVIVTGSIFIIGMVALYFKAFQLEWNYYLWHNDSISATSSSVGQMNTYTSMTELSLANIPANNVSLGALPSDISSDINSKQQRSLYDYALDSYLESQLDSYSLPFNTLAPGKWLTIDALDTTVRIIDVPYASQEKLAQADFDAELKQGVVKYPFTWTPGDGKSHPLIFGHSSVDSLEVKDNPYGYVFYQLPKLQYGDTIQVIRDGVLHEYEVEAKTVKDPDKVNEEMLAYADSKNSYLTLMACYPLLSDAQRILVRAKYKDPTSKHVVYHDRWLSN